LAPRFVVPEGVQGERVDRVLHRLIPDASRSVLQRWIRAGRVLLNGRACRSSDAVAAGSTLDVDPAPPPPSTAEPDPGVVFDVLFEDSDVIVVDKPAGLVVHPSRGHRNGTLVNGLVLRPGFRRDNADPRDPKGALRPGIVHRLDKDTSGVLVVAKTSSAREALKLQLFEHTVERRYRALTLGVPQAATHRTRHGRDPRSRLRFTSKTERGREAVTRVTPLETLAGGRAGLVECRLETGRTHQIRMHLSECSKTPIFADRLYGGARYPTPELELIGERLGRQALHAAVLGFVHPVTGRNLRFETPLPADMQAALDALRELASRGPDAK
jgi:23S rRNA pseudouridine1911/1915/1917 synthase